MISCSAVESTDGCDNARWEEAAERQQSCSNSQSLKMTTGFTEESQSAELSDMGSVCEKGNSALSTDLKIDENNTCGHGNCTQQRWWQL